METPIPEIGIGTWQNSDPEECAESVRTALETGYRHVDTAQSYGNEAAVGRGLAAADVDREAVFLATKVAMSNLAYDDVHRSVERSRERLGVDTIDLLYVHWPLDAYDAEGTLAAFQELYDEGTIEHIGVSNFEPFLLEEAYGILDAPILANQVEMHPLCPQAELRAKASEDGHRLVAYSPLIRGRALEHPVITSVAEEEGASPAQVSLAWCLAKGAAVIPKATGAAHIRENFAATDVTLSEESIERLDAIEEFDRQVDLDGAPWQ